ncbi:MAG: hypothetical protein JNJ54_30460 [Myxococcaceae bacterium]|nr:hypothetical protein [Myxococcaceae bacterium]
MTLTLVLALSLQGAPSVVDQVHFAFRREGGQYVAGHDTHRLERDERGAISFFPIGDRDVGPVDGALRLDLRRVSRGSQALDVTVRAVQPRGVDQLEVSRRGFVELLQNRGDGVEQSFRFETAPGRRGDLEVELETNARWLGVTARGHHFAAGQLLVVYGPATWVTADGERHALRTKRTAAGLRITVPAALVERSRFPATIDPVLSSESGIDQPVLAPLPGQQDAPAVGYDGSTWMVVWRDFRGGLGSDLYGARVNQLGALLDPGGLAIAVGPGGQYQPAITFGAGQYYVSFSDTRAGGSDISGMRLSTAGVPLDGDGVSLTTATGLQVNSDVVFNGTDYLVVWEDLRQGGMNSPDVYGARVTTAGVVLDPTPNLAISAASWGQYLPRAAADPASGTAFVVWEDTRNLESDIYGTRVSAAGAVSAVVPINRAAAAQDKADVAFNGADFIVVWTDRRSSTNGADIYAARVSTAGAVLDATGVLLSGAAGDQDWPAIAVGGAGADQFVVWRDGRNTTTDVFGTALTGSATPVTPMGVPVSTGGGAEAEPKLDGESTRYLVAFSDTRNGTPDIYATRVTLGPTVLVEDPAGVLVSIAANQQSTPALASDGTSFLAAWQDFRDGGADVFAIRVALTGAFLDAAPFVVSAAPGNESVPAVAFDGTNYVVAWSDLRTPVAQVYAARVSPAGAVLDPTGLAVTSNPTLPAVAPSIASLDGGSLVVWQAGLSPMNTDIYGARLSNAGLVLDTTGFPISAAAGTQSGPKVTVHDGDYLVAWTDTRNGNADIFAARVSTSGVVLDALGIGVSLGAQTSDSVSVSSNGSTALFVWRDTRASVSTPSIYGIYGARFTGGLVVDGSGLPIATRATVNGNPAVGWDEPRQQFNVFWDNSAAILSGELEGTDVNLQGAVSVSVSYGPGRMPLLSYSTAGPGLLGTQRFMPAPDHNFRARLRLAGKRAAGAPCSDAAHCLSGRCLVEGLCGAVDGGLEADAGLDGGLQDAGVDGGVSDAGVSIDDAGVPDAGASDAGAPDAGPSDAGALDAGADAGLAIDAGVDSGVSDDAGVIDAGATSDAGQELDGGAAGTRPRELAVGCGCGSTMSSLCWLLAVLAWWRRRTP